MWAHLTSCLPAQNKLKQVTSDWKVYELKRQQAQAELHKKAMERERAQAEAEAKAKALREAQEAAAREAAAKQAAVLAKHKQGRAVMAVRGKVGCPCHGVAAVDGSTTHCVTDYIHAYAYTPAYICSHIALAAVHASASLWGQPTLTPTPNSR